MTESGKTTLATRLADRYRAQGIGVIVLDQICDPRWNADFITADMDEFLGTVWQSRQCAVFIDEGGDVIGQYDKAMHRVATRGRHWGHNVHICAQGATQVAKIVRNQCRHLFLFATAREDCAELAREWNKPELLAAANFPAGEYFYASRFGPVARANIFNQ